MNCIEEIARWQLLRRELLSASTIGLVPTMGSLHQGHATLIERARRENEVVVVSVFVNPTQFNDLQDYQQYPKTVEADVQFASRLGVDYVLAPSAEEMYLHGNIFTINTRHAIAELFEGKQRPGHFAGMLTVVMKLLQLVRPTKVYFGEKDFQQSALVGAMAEDFFLDVDVVVCPIVREGSGLPLSSRNARLSASQRALAERAATVLGQVTPNTIDVVRQQLDELGVKVEYLDCYKGRIFCALRIGEIRLIDNFVPRVESNACHVIL